MVQLRRQRTNCNINADGGAANSNKIFTFMLQNWKIKVNTLAIKVVFIVLHFHSKSLCIDKGLSKACMI